MKIEELIEKYFEAETTPEEENILKEYFTSANYDKKLEIYRQYFIFLNSERNIVPGNFLPASILNENSKSKTSFNILSYKWLAIAASFLIIFIIAFTYFKSNVNNAAIVITNENFNEFKDLGTEVTFDAFFKISEYMEYVKSSINDIQAVNETFQILQTYNLMNYQ